MPDITVYIETERTEENVNDIFRVYHQNGAFTGYLKPVLLSTLIEEQLKDTWTKACTKILKDISDTFLKEDNLDKADTLNDRDVFQAVGESIRSFPIPDFPPKKSRMTTEELLKQTNNMKKLLILILAVIAMYSCNNQKPFNSFDYAHEQYNNCEDKYLKNIGNTDSMYYYSGKMDAYLNMETEIYNQIYNK